MSYLNGDTLGKDVGGCCLSEFAFKAALVFSIGQYWGAERTDLRRAPVRRFEGVLFKARYSVSPPGIVFLRYLQWMGRISGRPGHK